MEADTDFIGQGIEFPMRVNHMGSIAFVGGPAAVECSIRTVLSTAPGERTMRPRFGCRIWDQLFAPMNESTFGLMAQAVRDAVGQWEPRVRLEDVTVGADPAHDGRVLISVTYRLRATNDRRNLVYPFYVIPGE